MVKLQSEELIKRLQELDVIISSNQREKDKILAGIVEEVSQIFNDGIVIEESVIYDDYIDFYGRYKCDGDGWSYIYYFKKD